MKIDININERMKHYNVAGLSFALIDNGRIRTKESFGVLQSGTDNKVSDQTIFSACSISKFITSVLVMKLIDQGMLDLDEDVNYRLTSWKVPDNEFTKHNKVTLRTLLSHQSGVMDPKGSFSELNSAHVFPTMVEILDGTAISYCGDPIHVKYKPETEFHYSDAGFCIIQQLIEDVTGKPFGTVMHELIFETLHMENSIIIQSPQMVMNMNTPYSCGHHKDGSVVDCKYPIYPYAAAAGVWTTPSDLAVLLIELMNALHNNSKLGLSSNAVTQMFTAQGCKEWTGLGVFLDGSGRELEFSSLGWGVGFQCMLVAYPYSQSGAIIMTNTDLGMHQLKGIIGEIFNSLSS